MIAVELCCSSIKGNADPGVVFASLGVFGVVLVVMVMIRRRMPNPPRTSRNSFGGASSFGKIPPKITLNKTLIDGQEVTVIDGARVSHIVDTLKTPAGLRAALAANPNLWTEVNAALAGAGAIDPNGPFPVIARVRSALLTGQLDTVRQLLSDQLYQRLKALPPAAPNPSSLPVIMATNQHTGDDPNRVVVVVSASGVIPAAARETWVLVKAPEGSVTPAPTAQPATQPSTCPYCSAQLDPGSTRCRFCGMDATMAAPTLTPALAPAMDGWIVEDITAANQQAA
ncbi:MAG TPA: hypothetical protein VM674_04395 [Candidatus Acidoferrum sp.]|nr:hypothetical protein [Candidatus Acidoferrum sp.]